MALCIDIETLPTEDPVVMERVFAAVRPPGNIKKEDSIAAWWRDNGAQAKMDAVARTALNGDYGTVAVIATRDTDCDDATLFFARDGDERKMLKAFAEYYDGNFGETVVFNADFDLRFLWKRMVINGVRVPVAWPRGRRAGNVYDPMTEWAGYGEFIKQIELERILGITRPADITGADVAERIASGDWDAVLRHAEIDVDCLAQIYRRLR